MCLHKELEAGVRGAAPTEPRAHYRPNPPADLRSAELHLANLTGEVLVGLEAQTLGRRQTSRIKKNRKRPFRHIFCFPNLRLELKLLSSIIELELATPARNYSASDPIVGAADACTKLWLGAI